MLFDKLPGLLDRRSFVIGRFECPRDVGGDAHHVRVEAVRRAFVDELRVGPPASIWLLLTHQPVAGTRNHLPVHVINLRMSWNSISPYAVRILLAGALPNHENPPPGTSKVRSR